MKKPLSIMLIDDSGSSNLYHKVMMEEAGINIDTDVKEYICSTEAKNYLQNLFDTSGTTDFPNVFLLDINIPVFSGWDIVAFLESLDLGDPKPRVYMVSNSKSPRDLEKAKMHPIVIDILEKHVEMEFFANLMEVHSKT